MLLMFDEKIKPSISTPQTSCGVCLTLPAACLSLLLKHKLAQWHLNTLNQDVCSVCLNPLVFWWFLVDV